MARQAETIPATPLPWGEWPSFDSGLEMMQSTGRVFEQLLSLQLMAVSAWWGLQGQWLQSLSRGGEDLPAWMVWHNGTESLA